MPFLTQGKTNWKFIAIVAVLTVIVVGGILWFTKKQTTPITHLPQTESPGDKRYCIQESDCTLAYLGPDTCPSCVPDEYQCVATEYYNKVLWPEWEKTYKGIVCEGCPMITEKMQCICEENVCEKMEKDETADFDPSEIERWQTYRNEEYEFEFKYPAVFDKFEECKLKVTEYEEDIFINIGTPGAHFSIRILDVKGLDLAEYVMKEKEELLRLLPSGVPLEKIWQQENVYVSNLKGIKIIYTPSGHLTYHEERIYLLRNDTVYDIRYNEAIPCLELIGADEVYDEYEIFKKIPRTLHFLN